MDRVEFAYLSEFLARSDPVFGLVRTRFGFVLLDRPGMAALRGRLRGEPAGKPDLIGRLSWRRDPERAAAESDVRRDAFGRVTVPLLGRLLRRLPRGIHYLNVGHANLTDRVMTAVKALDGRI